MKLRVVCIILFVCVFPEGCKLGSSEAKAVANQYYDRLGTHCGDRYFDLCMGRVSFQFINGLSKGLRRSRTSRRQR